MSLGKGILSYGGVGVEGTYGTPGTVDVFFRLISETLRVVKDPFMSERLDEGWIGDMFYGPQRVEGDIVVDVTYEGLEIFLWSLFGFYQFTGGTPNDHDFSFDPDNNNFPVGLTIEIPRGVGGSTVNQYVGCHVTKIRFEFQPKQVVRAVISILGQSLTEATATAASFPTYLPVLPRHMSAFSINGNLFTALTGAIEVEVPRKSQREHFGSDSVKEPVIIGRPRGGASLTCELDDTSGADSHALYSAGYVGEAAQGNLLLSFANGAGETLTITGTDVFVKGEAPSVQGPDINQLQLELEFMDAAGVVLENTAAQAT